MPYAIEQGIPEAFAFRAVIGDVDSSLSVESRRRSTVRVALGFGYNLPGPASPVPGTVDKVDIGRSAAVVEDVRAVVRVHDYRVLSTGSIGVNLLQKPSCGLQGREAEESEEREAEHGEDQGNALNRNSELCH
jgi:hypothetical protein